MNSRASAFVAKWRYESREHAESQSWWNDLFEVFGVDRFSTAVFERWARRASTGNKGRIDVFMPGVMIAEHKSLGKDGGKAESQAEDYLAGGDIPSVEMPRYIVSTDFAEIQIADLASPLDPPVRFPITKLPANIGRFAFLSGYEAPIRSVEHADVTVKAARKMGALYDALLGDLDASGDGPEAEQAAIFMTRLLFLMYGDDAVGLWEPDAFQHFLETCTVEDGSDTGAQIAVLFQVLDTPIEKRSPRIDDHLKVFPYVNGGLFRERVDIPTFDRPMRDALLRAINDEWASVSPAIFGSLFQGMATREKRREQGEHYTTELNILKVLRPLFLDELELKLQAAWPSVNALKALHASLSDLRFLDPACGSGNFLIVAYRELRDFELRLILRLRDLREEADYALDSTMGLRVTPDQFAGIEINWWPAKIAETALFLVDNQANQLMATSVGAAPNRLPITVSANIVHANALQIEWSEAIAATESTYVFGNPPFVGQYTKSDEQTADIKLAWGADFNGYLDFVTAWHGKALGYLAGLHNAAFAFVTTNSIVQGQPVPALFKPIFKEGWRISFAHRTFAWQSEATGAAHVHCVIVGFDKKPTAPRLFDYESLRGQPIEVPATHINPYLVDGPDLFVDKRMQVLSPALAKVTKGSVPADGGNLLVEVDDYAEVAADPVAAKFLRPFIGASELINDTKRWCLWITDLDSVELKKSPVLQHRLEQVKKMRVSSSDLAIVKAASWPSRFQYIRQPATPFVCIPRHFSEDREWFTAAYFEPTVIAGDATFTAPDPDGLLFAVIESGMFMAWQRMIGGRIKSDPRFANTVTWNTFPFPALAPADRAKIIAAGKQVLAARAAQPGKSLASLYDPLTIKRELVTAHNDLDRVIDRLFGFAKLPSEGARQQRLFERYVAAVHAGQLTIDDVKQTRRNVR